MDEILEQSVRSFLSKSRIKFFAVFCGSLQLTVGVFQQIKAKPISLLVHLPSVV